MSEILLTALFGSVSVLLGEFDCLSPVRYLEARVRVSASLPSLQ